MNSFQKIIVIALIGSSSCVVAMADSLFIRFAKPNPEQFAQSQVGIDPNPPHALLNPCKVGGSPGAAIWGYAGQQGGIAETEIAADSPNYGLQTQMQWDFQPQYSVCLPTNSASPNWSSTTDFTDNTVVYQAGNAALQFIFKGFAGPSAFSQNNVTYSLVTCTAWDATSVVCCFSTNGTCDWTKLSN